MSTISDYLFNTRVQFPFMDNEYEGHGSIVATQGFQEMLTQYIDMNYGSLDISPSIMRRVTQSHPIHDIIRRACTLMYKSNEYRYETLYDTTIQEYNPIENYRMVEEIHTEYKGTETNNRAESGTILSSERMSGTETDTRRESGAINTRDTMSGAETDTHTKTGRDTDALTRGGVTDTDVTYSGSEKDELKKTGTETDNKTLNDGKSTSTHKVSPMDATNYVASYEDVNETNTAKTDNTTITHNTTDTNTKTFTNRKDTTKVTESGTDTRAIDYDTTDTNTKTFDERYNNSETTFDNRETSDTKSYSDRVNETETSFNDRTTADTKSFNNREDVTTHTRSGNIGVTTTQQMLQSSRELAEFNFLSIVAHDVVKQIAVCVY